VNRDGVPFIRKGDSGGKFSVKWHGVTWSEWCRWFGFIRALESA
jgi:hypothetical protein